MSCILRISGEHLDIDVLLSSVRIRPDNIWRRGEPRFRSKPNGKINERSGVTFVASEAGFCDFEIQIEEATKFLEEHLEVIEMIVSFEFVQDVTLDFGIELRDVAIHSDILPPRFLKAAGMAGITVELSHYPCSTEEPQSEVGSSNGG